MRLSRLLAGLATVGLIAIAAPAWANTDISINPGNVSTTAAGFSGKECGGIPGGPYADKDVWVFNLAGNHDTTGDFVSISATFTTPDGPVTFVIPTDGGAIFLNGTSKAYIVLPAGYTLTGATAVISGTADKFVLTHTCPANGNESPSPSPSPSASTSETPTPGTSTSTSSDPRLPTTGAPVGTLVLTGTIAAGAGAGMLLFLHRRRKAQLAALTKLD